MSGKSSLFIELKDKLVEPLLLVKKKIALYLVLVKLVVTHLIPYMMCYQFIDSNSISLAFFQLCEKGNQVFFDKENCEVKSIKFGNVIITAPGCVNIYVIFTNNIDSSSLKCLKALTDNPRLRHRRQGHLNMHTIKLLASHDLVRGLPKYILVIVGLILLGQLFYVRNLKL